MKNLNKYGFGIEEDSPAKGISVTVNGDKVIDTTPKPETTPVAAPVTPEPPVMVPEAAPVPQPQDALKPDVVGRKKMVFLGGTCNGSNWRNTLIQGLELANFNPVTQNWSEDDKAKEDEVKDAADFNLFTFTPKHTGFFSFVEAAVNAIKSPSRTVICVLDNDDGATFDQEKKASIDASVETLKEQGVQVFTSLDETRNYLNSQKGDAI